MPRVALPPIIRFFCGRVHEHVIPDSHEADWQYVLEKFPDELEWRKVYGFVGTAFGMASPDGGGKQLCVPMSFPAPPQQIWRLVSNSVWGNRMLIICSVSAVFYVVPAKQLNRTISPLL